MAGQTQSKISCNERLKVLDGVVRGAARAGSKTRQGLCLISSHASFSI